MFDSLKRSYYNCAKYLSTNKAGICTVFGISGVVITAILTADSTIKAVKKEEKIKDESIYVKVKEIAPLYIAPAISCASTIYLCYLSHVLNQKKTDLFNCCIFLFIAVSE